MTRAALLVLAVVALAITPGRAAEHGQKAQKAPEHKTTQSESYIMVDPIYTTIVVDNRVAGMLMIGYLAYAMSEFRATGPAYGALLVVVGAVIGIVGGFCTKSTGST